MGNCIELFKRKVCDENGVKYLDYFSLEGTIIHDTFQIIHDKYPYHKIVTIINNIEPKINEKHIIFIYYNKTTKISTKIKVLDFE